jgi:hypothetical protein
LMEFVPLFREDIRTAGSRNRQIARWKELQTDPSLLPSGPARSRLLDFRSLRF